MGSEADKRPLLWHLPLPAGDAAELIEYHRANQVQMNLYLDDKLYAKDDRDMRPLIDLYCARTGSKPEFLPDLTRFSGESPTKIILMSKPARRNEMYDELHPTYGDRLWMVKTDPEYLEFLNPADNFDPLVLVCAPGDPGFDCMNDGVGNFVAVGQTLQGVNFCGGNLDGQEPAFFGISTLQRLTCTWWAEASTPRSPRSRRPSIPSYPATWSTSARSGR